MKGNWVQISMFQETEKLSSLLDEYREKMKWPQNTLEYHPAEWKPQGWITLSPAAQSSVYRQIRKQQKKLKVCH